MIIDSHAHLMRPQQQQLMLMNDAGIDRTILFPSIVHPETATTLEEWEQEMDRLSAVLNGNSNPLHERQHSIDELVAAVAAQPDRYIGFGSIPFGLSFNENLNWIDRMILGNRLRGIGELTPASGQVPKLEPLFQASRERGNLPLWVHAFFPLHPADIDALLQLAKRYATVPLIVGHLGGLHWLSTVKAVRELPNVYLDLSATFTTIAPAFAIQECPDRVLFSSDAPYSTPLAARTIIEQLTSDKQILAQVLGENIARLLHLS